MTEAISDPTFLTAQSGPKGALNTLVAQVAKADGVSPIRQFR